MSFLDGLNNIITKYTQPNAPGNPFTAGLDSIVKKYTPPVATPYIPHYPDNSTAGIVFNTISGIPDAAVTKAKDIAQSTAKNFASAGITLMKKPQLEETPTSKFLFGNTGPVKDLGTRIVEAESRIKESPTAKKYGVDKFASPLAFTGVIGGTLLDLSMFGGGKAVDTAVKDAVPESVIKFFAKHDAPAIEDALNKMGVDAINSKILANKMGPETTTQGIKDILIEHKPVGPDISKLPIAGETPAEALARSEAYAKAQHPKVQISDEGIPMARKSIPFMPKSVSPANLPELQQIESGAKSIVPTENRSYPSDQSTINKLNFQVTGDTAKQKIQSAITNSVRIKNELTTTGQSAETIGNQLPAHDVRLVEKYESGTPVNELIKQAEDPIKFKKFMDKLINYYDFRLAADRAAGGATEKVKNYIPHQWDLSKPADLEKFNKLAVQKGLQPYNGFHAQPRVFSTYAEGEAQGFKRANKNILEDLKNDYSASGTVISRQVLKKNLSEGVPAMVSSRGFGRTVTGRPYVNSNIPGLEGISYDPYVHRQLKGFQPRTDQNLFKNLQENNPKNVKDVWNTVKETGVIDTVTSLYDKGNKGLKTLILNFSGFHSINISLSYAGHALFSDPLRGATGILKSLRALTSEKYTQEVIESYKKDMIPGLNISVFDAGLRSGVNMTRELNPIGNSKFNPLTQSSHLIFDRELHILKLETVKMAFGSGKINPESVLGRDLGKEINMLMGEMNKYTQNINPNTMKWLDRTLLAAQFTGSKFKMTGDAAFKYGKDTAGNFARKAVIGKSIIIGLLATFGTLIATGKFPNLKQVALNFTIDPGTQTNLTNTKGQKIDIKYPKSFISEAAGLGIDPKQYAMNRLAPGFSTTLKVGYPPGTGTDQYGNPIVDVNKKESKSKQYAKNLGQGLLPIGLGAGLNAAEGKITPTQAGINILGLQTKTNANDPTVIKYKTINDAKKSIADISPDDPKRTEKIQEIYNTLDTDQKKSLNYQLLLEGVSTKGVLSGDAGKIKPLYDKLQIMKAEGKTEEANAIWSKLSKEDKVLYKKVKTYYKKSNTSQAEKDFEPTFQEIRDMKTSGDPALEEQADARYNELSSEEKHIYQLLKKQNL